MNLTGRWKGKYTYGEGYPHRYIGRSEPFEFDITDQNGTISGTCIDQVVEAKEGNESYIIGTFSENQITFKKRYKFHFSTDESGSHFIDKNMEQDGVDYTGKLRKTIFTRKTYFSGEWSITSQYKDAQNRMQTIVGKGTWKMKKKS